MKEAIFLNDKLNIHRIGMPAVKHLRGDCHWVFNRGFHKINGASNLGAEYEEADIEFKQNYFTGFRHQINNYDDDILF